MSRQIAPPRVERNSDGEQIIMVPREYCDDCDAKRSYPGRVYKVGRREICADCWEAARIAPSVLHFHPRLPGIY